MRRGSDVTAAAAGRGIALILARFLPQAFQISSRPELKLDTEPATTLYPAPVRSSVSTMGEAYTASAQQAVRMFKEALMNGDVGMVASALRPTGILRKIDNPTVELQQLEMKAARTSGSARLFLLSRMAKLALWTGNPEKAGIYASEALSLVLAPQIDHFNVSGQAIHDANMVAGLLALHRGDLTQARQHLLASSRTRGSRELGGLGPNLTLADELLKRGEREVVMQYLDQARSFWSGGKQLLDKWINQIRSGETPEVDVLLLTP